MNDKDDQQWLDALAGRANANADPATTAQAQALRTAMLARRYAIEQATQHADPAEFEALRARLQREGLLNATVSNAKQPSWLGALWQKVSPSLTGSVAVPLWSVAATVVLGIGVVVQIGLLGNGGVDEANVMRGGSATVLVVANPTARLLELSTGLTQANAHYVVLKKGNGEIQLIVQADDAAMVYLQSQRLTPTVREGVVVIVLRVHALAGTEK
jgi:hypothetical protein